MDDGGDERFARFMQHLPGLAWIKDLSGRYVYVNDAAEKAFGRPRAELCGKSDDEIFPPQTAAEFRQNDRQALANESGIRTIETLADHQGRPRQSIVSKFPILGPRGEPVLVGGIAIDISEQIEAKKAREDAETQLHIVLDSMSAPVTRCSRDLRYLWVSKAYADWQGRSPAQIVGRPIAEVIGEAALAALLPHFDDVLAGKTVKYEQEIDFRNLGRRWVSAVYTPTFDAGGVPDGWVAVVTDIDDRKRLEEASRQSDRRKDEFLATLAHELRNPLAPIRNALEILQLKGPPVPDLVWARDVIDRQLQQMIRLVDDLLDISRITTGKLGLRKERVELASVLHAAVETSRPLIEKCGHALTLDVPENPILLDADLTRLAQAFSNLLNNAAKYTQHSGLIELAARVEGSSATIRVKDNGVGIPSEMLGRIFDMFAQVDRHLEWAQGGLGVGLTLVEKIIQMHGGSIEAKSEGAGRGSEFIVRLPVVKEPQLLSEEAGGNDEAAHKPPLRILTVDDNQDSADSLAMLLRIMGHDVRTAYDGLAAIEAAQTFRPDLVLLDLGMPKLSGYEACRRIRALGWGQSIVMVALTGWGQDDDRRRTLEAGFDHHLVKPVDPHVLANLLAQLRAEASD